MKIFNNAGPSVPGQHYMIDPLVRIDLPEIETLIAQQRYFVLHAPRQTGKTTSLLALMHHLNAQGRYRAVYANIEGAQAARGDVASGVATLCSVIARSVAYYLGDKRLDEWLRNEGNAMGAGDRVSQLLAHWSQSDPRPAVLLLDEVDALVGDTLISLLRQIRAGYAQRPDAFPQTVVLCGVRDVRDYRIHTAHHEIITGGSAFNIKAVSLRLGNLSRAETEALWRQHEEETGQRIDPAIYPELWEDTEGQPWLVNALGYECTWTDRPARDRSVPITLERYKAARERLIQSRATHLDQLTDKLREDRVQRVVIELKLPRKAPEATLAEGLAQTAEHAERCGAGEAYLLLFDRRPGRSRDERVWQREEAVGARTIGVWGM
ncbi:MAG: AAA-like domain-containing protein [Betaproteobacteria bacterium]|nr:AAA-like domain-containing protein [Betaproteobacteria bacterium]